MNLRNSALVFSVHIQYEITTEGPAQPRILRMMNDTSWYAKSVNIEIATIREDPIPGDQV